MAAEREERPEVHVGCHDDLASFSGPTQDRLVVSGSHSDIDNVQRIVPALSELFSNPW